MFEWLQHGFMVQALVACGGDGAPPRLPRHPRGRPRHRLRRPGARPDLVDGRGLRRSAPATTRCVCSMLGDARRRRRSSRRLRVRDPRLRLEAVIGIFYAVSSAITVLLIAKTPHGDADIQDVLFGNVLALDRATCARCWSSSRGVASAHVAARPAVLRAHLPQGERRRDGASRDHLSNLLFYLLLALAIVFAIRAGGVIPVFAFLILPPVAALASRGGPARCVVRRARPGASRGCFFGLELVVRLRPARGRVDRRGARPARPGSPASRRCSGALRRASAASRPASCSLALAGTFGPGGGPAQSRPDPAALAAEVAALRAELEATRGAASPPSRRASRAWQRRRSRPSRRRPRWPPPAAPAAAAPPATGAASS